MLQPLFFLLFVFTFFDLTFKYILGVVNSLLEGMSLLLDTDVSTGQAQSDHCDFVTLLVIFLQLQHNIDTGSLFRYAIQLG